MTSLEKAAQQTLEFLRTRRLGAEAHIAALESALAEANKPPQAERDQFDANALLWGLSALQAHDAAKGEK